MNIKLEGCGSGWKYYTTPHFNWVYAKTN